jgi:hypothetical protein
MKRDLAKIAVVAEVAVDVGAVTAVVEEVVVVAAAVTAEIAAEAAVAAATIHRVGKLAGKQGVVMANCLAHAICVSLRAQVLTNN